MRKVVFTGFTKFTFFSRDIAGHEKFGYMTRVYYKHAIGCAIVFDVTRYTSFQSVHKWLIDIREKIYLENGKMLPIVLFANKCDINEMCVSNEVVTKYCKENGIIGWYLTSAKENINIDEGMNVLIKEAMKLVDEDDKILEPPVRDSIKLTQTEPQTCCHS